MYKIYLQNNMTLRDGFNKLNPFMIYNSNATVIIF
jgi:hypothetical protein